MKQVVRLETNVCFRIMRLMNNRRKSRKRAAIHQKEEKAMTRMLWLLWKVYHNWVVYHKIQMHRFHKAESLGETRGKKSWNQFKRVRFTKSTLRHASIREKKGRSLGKINVKDPHQRSPYAMKFEDRSHEESERQQRCARRKAWNLAKNITSSKKKTRLHSSFPQRNGYSRLRQQKSRRKESLW